MKTRLVLMPMAMIACLCLFLSCATGPDIVEDERIAPLPLSGQADEASFAVYLFDHDIGTIDCSLDASGNYRRKATIALGGQTLETTCVIACDSAGRWKTAVDKTPVLTSEVKRAGGRATLKRYGREYDIPLPPRHLPYDKGGPMSQQIMIRAYDRKTGGTQVFSCFFGDSVDNVELSLSGSTRLTAGGREIAFDLFDVSVQGFPLRAWVLPDGRLAMLAVLTAHETVVRKGFEELLASVNPDPLLSKPTIKVRRETTKVPMRDGAGLSTDLYLPEGAGGRVPVVLIRTPYNKKMMELTGWYFASRGYAVAVQDCRGCFASEGAWEPFVNEAKDGYDAVEWAGAQPWSSGKVGMIGGSYVGWVQLWAAVEKPPHLATIIPNVAPPDPFCNIPYEYGVFFAQGALWWSQVLESRAAGDLSGQAMAAVNSSDYRKVFHDLPLVDADRRVLGRENPYWRAWIEHNSNDSYWEPANMTEKLKGLDIPVFLQSGWFDGDGIGSKLNYLSLKKSANRFQKLVLGPWGHTDQSSPRYGDRDFTVAAAPDLQIEYLRWFDHWLKGVDNGIEKEPLVRIFVMERNDWLTGDTYPLPATRFTSLYLDSREGANTSKGDGQLIFTKPSGRDDGFDSYRYDPADPTPWADYYFETDEERRAEKGKTASVEEQKKKYEAFHDKIAAERRDILVYQTEPLSEPVTVAGPVSAVLYASSSAPDTDWFANLMDVDENGKIFPLVHGALRARFRNSMSRPEMMEGGKVYEFNLDLWQTGITFGKGHRIRLEIASAMFPMFSRNLNTGGDNEKETAFRAADQKIYHGGRYPSHLLLPVIPVKQEAGKDRKPGKESEDGKMVR